VVRDDGLGCHPRGKFLSHIRQRRLRVLIPFIIRTPDVRRAPWIRALGGQLINADTGSAGGCLKTWERELITLVARGRTDTQIAAELYISIRTVRSHLDRIRDKTGCRRRADLTRLALTAGLV
jgi:DNA-binding CsgD family transcriptional regulator